MFQLVDNGLHVLVQRPEAFDGFDDGQLLQIIQDARENSAVDIDEKSRLPLCGPASPWFPT
ncbi:MAG: hypothetical protein IJG77_02565 [Aeriscardovia sp.]|nr:hypothetical protein [Aeriscardovia sp.]